MQSQSLLFRNGQQMQTTKQNQVICIMQLTKQMNLPQTTAFLAGFVIGQLQLGVLNKQNFGLLKKLTEGVDLVREQIIETKNFIEAIVEALDHVKKSIKQQQNKPKKKPEQKNRMRSEMDFMTMQCQGQSPMQQFAYYFTSLMSELALDWEYLRTLWLTQACRKQQQLKSAEMIHQMMAQQSQKQKIIQDQKLQCQICLTEIDFQDSAPLQHCGHIFHRLCLHEHLKAAITENNLQIKCPQQQCHNILTVNDVEAYIDGELLDKFYNFSLKNYVEKGDNMTSWCPTAGCSAVFQFDQMLDNYRCPVCKKHYCLKCRCDYHYGMSCAEYRVNNTYSEDDKKFEDFARGAKFKQCPKCKYWVERIAGCSSMACKCGIQFCYQCGGSGCPHGSCTGSGKKNAQQPVRNLPRRR